MASRGAPSTERQFLQRLVVVAAVIILALLLWEWRRVFLLAFGSILIAVGLRGFARLVSDKTPRGPRPALATFTGSFIMGLFRTLVSRTTNARRPEIFRRACNSRPEEHNGVP